MVGGWGRGVVEEALLVYCRMWMWVSVHLRICQSAVCMSFGAVAACWERDATWHGALCPGGSQLQPGAAPAPGVMCQCCVALNLKQLMSADDHPAPSPSPLYFLTTWWPPASPNGSVTSSGTNATLDPNVLRSINQDLRLFLT